jgi:uncharacterized DUF497 family protein
MIILSRPVEFEWDQGNLDKNWLRHGVANTEIEEVFRDDKKIIGPDFKHSTTETRYFLLGKTSKDRLLFLILTLRKGKVRVISARDLNKKQRRFYEETIKVA